MGVAVEKAQLEAEGGGGIEKGWRKNEWKLEKGEGEGEKRGMGGEEKRGKGREGSEMRKVEREREKKKKRKIEQRPVSCLYVSE